MLGGPVPIIEAATSPSSFRGEGMRIAAGVDVGSTQTKAVLMADNGGIKIVARALVDTGANVQKAGERAFDRCCQEAGQIGRAHV